MAGLQAVEPSESVDIPTENHLEVPTVASVRVHFQEPFTFQRVVAADRLIFVPADDVIAVLFGVGFDL